ncbi:unnamed protein product [Sphagnum troendelagicum]|jgi:hypothetical protein
MVVEPASAMQLAGNNFYKLEDCNHTEVCKPVDKQHPSYSILVDHLRTSREGTEPEPQEVLRERHAQAAASRQAGDNSTVGKPEQTQQHGDVLQVCNSSVGTSDGKREKTR